MNQTERLNSEDVAWVPPETKEAVLDDPGPEAQRFTGEYHVVEHELIEVEDADPVQHSLVTDKLVVWVDANPDDAEDGSGHFQLYDGKPDDYYPVKT